MCVFLVLMFVQNHYGNNPPRSAGVASRHQGTWAASELGQGLSRNHRHGQVQTYFKWWFPEIGVPPVIIHFSGSFPNKNHPFYGYPPSRKRPSKLPCWPAGNSSSWQPCGPIALDSAHLLRFGGFHSHGGTPIAGWFTMENPI